VQLLALFFQIFYCTYSYFYCLFILFHIPHLSVINIRNGSYAQPGEESVFTEESRSTPSESTGIQERSQSSLSIKCWPSMVDYITDDYCRPISLLSHVDDTDQELGDKQIEDHGDFTLSSNLEEDHLEDQQVVHLLGQACRDKSLQTTRVSLPKKQSRADTVIAHPPLPHS
jgi:hypothetical protein